MRKTVFAAAAVLTVILFAELSGQSADRQGAKSFQLVYHSDTRGYYRPCG